MYDISHTDLDQTGRDAFVCLALIVGLLVLGGGKSPLLRSNPKHARINEFLCSSFFQAEWSLM